MRGFPLYLDAVTGEPGYKGEAGVVFAGVGIPVSKAGSPYTTWVPLTSAQVGDASTTFQVQGITYDQVLAEAEKIREKEAAQKKKFKKRPTHKQGVAGVTETYRNAKAGVDLFMGRNSTFLETIGYTGVEDEIRAFLDGFEVQRGRQRKDGSYAHKRLVTTTKGREIAAAFKSSDEEGTREFLTWLFSRNRGKRWEDVNWMAVDALGDILANSCDEEKTRSRDDSMQCVGWEWYPPAAGLTPLAERLEDLTPKAAAQVENVHYADKLGYLVQQLRKSLKKAKSCLPEHTQETIRQRISYIAKLAKEPWRVEGATICGEDKDTGDIFCGFPAIEAEVVQLRKACEFGYDPNWPLAEGLSPSAAQTFGLPVAVATGETRPFDIEGQAVTLEELEAIPWHDTEENPDGKKPPSAGTLDAAGKSMLWTVYEAAKKHYRKQGERGARLKQLAARVAWAEVKRHYYKRGSQWKKRKNVLPREADGLDLRQRSLPLKARRKGGSKPKRASSKANPSRSHPWGQLLDLRARVVELEIEMPDGRVSVHTWNKDRPALFWSEKRKALVWVHGGKDPGGFVDDEHQAGPVAARHRKWHGADPSEVGSVELPAGPLSQLGPALRIVYFAERYRDGRPRHHDFGAGVAAYAQKGRGARVFECRGGRLTLNDRGLVF